MTRWCNDRIGRLAVAAVLLVATSQSLPSLPAAGQIANSALVLNSVPRPDHVVVVVEENHAGSQVLGNPDAPYLNSLAANGANFSASYAVTHPSEPNYLALFSGATQGVTDDSCPHAFTAPSLGDELIAAGLTFTGYAEDLPAAGDTRCSSGAYARKHSPWVDFPAVPAASNQPMTSFPSDLSTLPDVSFVIPNLTHDMHDGTIAQGDTWLRDHLAAYATWAATHNSLLVVTFDEDDSRGSNQIATLMAGERVVAGDYGARVDHYAVLRTLTDAFGLPPLGAAADRDPIQDVWTPPNGDQPPVPAFTSSCTENDCAFDPGSSTDPDGSITRYRWDFGDGAAPVAGSTVSHTYVAGGTYAVTLTVVDDAGAARSKTVSIEVVGPFAVDTFDRSVESGLGRADVGGDWTLSGPATSFSVAPGAATIRLPQASAQAGAYLAGPKRTDTDVRTDVSLDVVPAGGAAYLTVQGRRVSYRNEYDAKIVVNADRTVTVRVTRMVAGTETALAGPVRVAGLTYAAGMPLRVRLAVTGTNPTTLRAKVWSRSGSEPATWQVSATDATAALQVAGTVGLIAYVNRAVTNAPVAASWSAFSARPVPAPSSPPVTAYLLDAFARTVSAGLGTADVGGAWSLVGPAASFSVASGSASLALARAASQLAAFLPTVIPSDADVRVGLALSAVPTGGPAYLTVQSRRVGASAFFAAKLVVYPGGAVTVRLIRVSGGVETAIAAPVVVAGLTYGAGTVLRVRVQTSGTAPTTLRARVWPASSAEPTGWQVTASDSTGALQVPGAVGVIGYLNGAVANAPITVAVSGLSAQPVG